MNLQEYNEILTDEEIEPRLKKEAELLSKERGIDDLITIDAYEALGFVQAIKQSNKEAIASYNIALNYYLKQIGQDEKIEEIIHRLLLLCRLADDFDKMDQLDKLYFERFTEDCTFDVKEVDLPSSKFSILEILLSRRIAKNNEDIDAINNYMALFDIFILNKTTDIETINTLLLYFVDKKDGEQVLRLLINTLTKHLYSNVDSGKLFLNYFFLLMGFSDETQPIDDDDIHLFKQDYDEHILNNKDLTIDELDTFIDGYVSDDAN